MTLEPDVYQGDVWKLDNCFVIVVDMTKNNYDTCYRVYFDNQFVTVSDPSFWLFGNSRLISRVK